MKSLLILGAMLALSILAFVLGSKLESLTLSLIGLIGLCCAGIMAFLAGPAVEKEVSQRYPMN